jgi:hypothetical protein
MDIFSVSLRDRDVGKGGDLRIADVIRFFAQQRPAKRAEQFTDGASAKAAQCEIAAASERVNSTRVIGAD